LKTRFIVNPRSGRAAAVVARVREFAAARGDVVQLTSHPGHATELAAQALADGCELIVAVGGDGTMNEVAGCLVNTPATFGLIACGSGNGLGRHLGMHGSVQHSLEILRTGKPRLIDSGVADEHPFFCIAGMGFEADVSARFNKLKGRGFLRYITTAAQLWRRQAPLECWIEHEGQRIPTRAFTLAVANSDQYGNNAIIAPGARVDDGRLDLTAIPPVGMLRAGSMLLRLFTASIGRAPGVLRLQAPQFVIERASPGLIHTDGETHQAGTRVEFAIRPNSLRVLAPDDAKGR
jgi:diacylglycerol kinase (ATP)